MTVKYVEIDVHSAGCTVCTLNEAGQVEVKALVETQAGLSARREKIG